MKAAPFRYERPDSLEQALELLGDPESKALAGGQSLVPMMAMRLARPRMLVDLSQLAELAQIEEQDGELGTGAMVRQRSLERLVDLARKVPLLAAALPHVGHREIRNRGTIGGSIAHADPAAELGLVAATLRAKIVARGADGSRDIAAEELVTGPFSTQLASDELLLSVRWPKAGAGDGFAFAEVARRHGDFALCGTAVHVRRSDHGIELARVGLLGVGPTPVVHEVTTAVGDRGSEQRIGDVAAELSERVQPSSDMHASAGYRRRLVEGAGGAVPRSRAQRRVLRQRAMNEVTLTVNGTEVTLEVEPRLTLADALRHRLGLTGTHLGCEHGVCGACTVLVDGAAARSCLLFCVQADGAEITTVEALGTVDDMHPLQQAFRHRHGLQCGFCTPGFLISAYELLRDGNAGLDDERYLREQLSGVLCRCTGYAGIVEAVREVAAAHPRGVPPPKRLGVPITVLRSVPPSGEEHALAVASSEPPATAAARQSSELAIPQGRPNEAIEVTTTISPAPEETWKLLSDFKSMSRCMPGVELDSEEAQDTYSGHVRVHLGPMRLDFAGGARVLERDAERRRLRAVASGRDASGSGVQADVVLRADAAGSGGTSLAAEAKLYLSGRAAQFGRSLAGDVSRQLFAEFGKCVERTLITGEAAQPRRLAGAALGWRLFKMRLRSLSRRIPGRGDP